METTDKVWLGALGALLAYETYTLVNKKKHDTLSEGVWRALPRRPILPFGLGFLIGHFVWQSQSVYDRELVKELTSVVKQGGTVSA